MGQNQPQTVVDPNQAVPCQGDEAVSRYRPAFLHERLCAFVTDHLILLFLAAAALVTAGLLTHQTVPTVWVWARENFVITAGAGLAAYFLYFFGLEGIFTTSPGKALTGLVLRKKSDRPPSVFAVFVRNLFRLVDYPLFLVTGLCLAESTRFHQRLGDLVGGTIVVKKNAPVPPPGLLRYAGSARRLLGFALDLMLWAVLGYGLFLTLSPASFPLRLWAALAPAVILLSSVCSEIFFQATFGKFLTGLKVMDHEGTRPSVGQIVLRYVLLPLDLTPLSYFLILFSAQKQRLGDLFAGTVVVSSHRPWWRRIGAVPFMLGLTAAALWLGLPHFQRFEIQDHRIKIGPRTMAALPPLLVRYLDPRLKIERIVLGPEAAPEEAVTEFHPDDAVQVRVRTSGFKAEQDRARLSLDLQVLSDQGDLLLEVLQVIHGRFPIPWDRVITLNTRFRLHPLMPAGDYQVRVVVRDLVSNRQTESSQDMAVR